MHHISIFDRIKLTLLVNTQVAPSGAAVTGGEVDMKGFGGVAFLMPVGALDGVLDLKIMSSTTAGGTLTTITGAAITQMTAGQDNNIVVVDVYRPTNRFLKPVYTAQGASGANIAIVALQYDPNGLTPVTQAATVDEIVKKVEN